MDNKLSDFGFEFKKPKPFDGHLNKPSCCAGCGKNLDGATGVEKNVRPKVGDVTICVYCLTIQIFGPGMILHQPDDNEMGELVKSGTWDNLHQLIERIKEFKQANPDLITGEDGKD
jgi:hypothetical protein